VTSATDASGQDAPNGMATSATRMRKHSLDIAGHRTSISLEDAFWDALREIAAAQGLSLAGLVARIDAERDGANLSSAIRVFVLQNGRPSREAPP
jgi:predicted DNA-binding ribbon-helix-helix protein